MPGMRVKFDVSGIQLVDRTMLGIAEHAADLLPAFESVATLFGEAEHEQFATEGSVGSGAWAPLSPQYAAWKLAHFPGTKILHRTGALEKSLTRRPFAVEHIGPQILEVGTDVPYARYHQQGGPHLPKRPPIAIGVGVRRAMVKQVQRWIRTGSI